MVGVTLTITEKTICPKIKLKTKTKELNDFIKKTHKKLREQATINKRRERELIKEKEKVNKAFKESFKKMSRVEKKKKEILENKYKILATTKDLSRILSLFECENNLGLSDITQTAMLTPKVCKNALSFLLKQGILKQGKGRQGTLTFIKEEK